MHALQAFNSDFHVHWAQHFLRPEFIESTYALYQVFFALSVPYIILYNVCYTSMYE